MASTGRGTTYIALLRGINVGGNRKVPMKDLKAVVEEAGAEHVSTYVQSGNVVLRSTLSAEALRTALERGIQQTFGFPVSVVIRTLAELKKIVKANPYLHASDDPTKVHVVFLAERIDPALANTIDPSTYAPDAFVVKGREVYLDLPNGAGRSKLATVSFEKDKGDARSATSRNWRSVVNLLELAEETDAR